MTKQSEKLNWKCVGGLSNNKTLNFDGFYISFATGSGLSTLSIFSSDSGSSETALCVEDKFFILNGDFREDYERLGPKGLKDCMDFFIANKEKSSTWSDEISDGE